MNWVILILACLFEVGRAVGLKYAEGIFLLASTVFYIIAGTAFFVMAMKRLPPSFAHITSVVFGMIGSYIVDVAFFGKTVHRLSALSILVMLFGIFQLDRSK